MLIIDLPPRLQFRGTLHLESPSSSQAAANRPPVSTLDIQPPIRINTA